MERPDPDELLTFPEAARIAGLGLGTLQTQRKRGKLAVVRRGRDWFITRDELHRYLTSRDDRRGGTSAPLPPGYVAPRGLEESEEAPNAALTDEAAT
jgi:excisionase family DNA binding protein